MAAPGEATQFKPNISNEGHSFSLPLKADCREFSAATARSFLFHQLLIDKTHVISLEMEETNRDEALAVRSA